MKRYNTWARPNGSRRPLSERHPETGRPPVKFGGNIPKDIVLFWLSSFPLEECPSQRTSPLSCVCIPELQCLPWLLMLLVASIRDDGEVCGCCSFRALLHSIQVSKPWLEWWEDLKEHSSRLALEDTMPSLSNPKAILHLCLKIIAQYFLFLVGHFFEI